DALACATHRLARQRCCQTPIWRALPAPVRANPLTARADTPRRAAPAYGCPNLPGGRGARVSRRREHDPADTAFELPQRDDATTPGGLFLDAAAALRVFCSRAGADSVAPAVARWPPDNA